MIYLFLLPLYIGFHVFFFMEVYKWMEAIATTIKTEHNRKVLLAFEGVLTGLYSFCALCLLLAFAIPDKWADSHGYWRDLRRIIKLIGNYHEGVFIYLMMGFVIAEFMRIPFRLYYKIRRQPHRLNKLRHSIVGMGCFLFIVILTVCGIVKAHKLETTNYSITVNKSCGEISELKVGMVADLHLGYNIGVSEMRKMVDKLNAEQLDVVVIAGDIFDNEYTALDDPKALVEILGGIKSKYGVYACYGNHDIDETILGGFSFGGKKNKQSSLEMDSLLEQAGITLLRDEAVLVADSFYIYGRPDYSRPGRGITERRTPEELMATMDADKPIIVLDHQPRELNELAAAGVDVDLCGHTHDGQFFPLNLTSRYLTWENSCGYLKKGNMHNIVTSGVGVFGPNMRVGTTAEVCVIDIAFAE